MSFSSPSLARVVASFLSFFLSFFLSSSSRPPSLPACLSVGFCVRLVRFVWVGRCVWVGVEAGCLCVERKQAERGRGREGGRERAVRPCVVSGLVSKVCAFSSHAGGSGGSLCAHSLTHSCAVWKKVFW